MYLPARIHLSGRAAAGTEFQLPFVARHLSSRRVLFPNLVIRADDLARAMVEAAIRGTEERGGLVLENRDIRSMVALRV